jgi:hypothetical protein
LEAVYRYIVYNEEIGRRILSDIGFCVPEKDCPMRVALLASTIALLAASPAFAQCVYVACNNGSQGAPVYQQPAYQAPTPAPHTAPGYDEGYAAGLAARPATRHRVQPAKHAKSRSATTRSTSTKRTGSGLNASNIYGRSTAGSGPRTKGTSNVRRPATTRHVATTRRAPVRTAQIHRATNTQYLARQRTYSSSTTNTYQDTIKDRAATYRPLAYGQSTTMASMMSRSGSYSSTTTTWVRPATIVNQGGQVCGWGARIVTYPHGYAQREAMWVCQCPQGWRPPGY